VRSQTLGRVSAAWQRALRQVKAQRGQSL
jgi:hypothetical protein